MNHQCVWMKSKAHINHINSFWWTLFIKCKDIFLKLKTKMVFSKIKIYSYENTYKFYVFVYELEQSTTNLSFIFYSKTKNVNAYKHLTQVFTWKSSLRLDLIQNLIHELDSSLSTWCDRDVCALECCLAEGLR